MKMKTAFGGLLTILGIAGLIYAAYYFITSEHQEWRTTLIVFVIATIFFSSGISLIKGIKDDV